ncbi:MAG: hypothetical protein IJC52_01295 [Clostridia bacterium]|nr:hypothetical protein [Clostridia bacterium]
MKRTAFRLPSELAYLLGLALMSLAVSMTAAADFGVSMIVAPAYILSLKCTFLTFGQAEYIVQGLLFIAFCIAMRRVRLSYFVSFATGLLYGLMLDAWRLFIPVLNPDVTVPGSMSMPVRLVFLLVGMVITSLAVALLFRVYICPPVYDFFVVGITEKYRLDRILFKRLFDAGALLLAAAMSLILFGGFRGIGWGTVLMTVCNGVLIGRFSKLLDRTVSITPQFPRAAKWFELT